MAHICVAFWGAAADALAPILLARKGTAPHWADQLDDPAAYNALVGLKVALAFAVPLPPPAGGFDQHDIAPYLGGAVPSGNIAAFAATVQVGLALDLNDPLSGGWEHPVTAGWLSIGPSADPVAIYKAQALLVLVKDALDK